MLLEDLRGRTFGRLRVEDYASPPESGKITKYVCYCDPDLEYPPESGGHGCGTVTEVFETHLMYGKTHSCGCLQVESRSTKGRLTVINRPTYMEWYSKRRYKGNLAPEWDDKDTGFKRFLDDMGPKPPGAHLRRTDKREPYSKGNAFWQVAEPPTEPPEPVRVLPTEPAMPKSSGFKRDPKERRPTLKLPSAPKKAVAGSGAIG